MAQVEISLQLAGLTRLELTGEANPGQIANARAQEQGFYRRPERGIERLVDDEGVVLAFLHRPTTNDQVHARSAGPGASEMDLDEEENPLD